MQFLAGILRGYATQEYRRSIFDRLENGRIFFLKKLFRLSGNASNADIFCLAFFCALWKTQR